MSIWGNVFAALYDSVMAGTERAFLGARRERLLAGARGRVLEIGGGTGVNLQYYGAGVDELVITEPEEPMARRLERRLSLGPLSATVLRAPAESIPVGDASVDYVVSTLVLCTVSDPDRALAEVSRVLAPGGRLLFIEHVRSDEPSLARWQDRLAPIQLRLGHGCNCNRPTLESIRRAGFDVVELEQTAIPKAPPIVRPVIIGAATPA